MDMIPIVDVETANEARDMALDWQTWMAEQQDLSYGDLVDWAAYFGELSVKFPELAEEFSENGII
jgi:hypothetical protein